MKGVLFQQGVASEVFVDAVARMPDELEAANYPPSKRRKEDASTCEVADMLSADPEQVVCLNAGGAASYCGLACGLVSSAVHLLVRPAPLTGRQAGALLPPLPPPPG